MDIGSLLAYLALRVLKVTLLDETEADRHTPRCQAGTMRSSGSCQNRRLSSCYPASNVDRSGCGKDAAKADGRAKVGENSDLGSCGRAR